MGMAKRRRSLGHSQEKLAELLGVDRTTIGRWESGRSTPQPPQRRGLANALELSLDEVDALLTASQRSSPETARRSPSDHPSVGEPDEMIRREFLRILTVSGALTALPIDDAEALKDGVLRGTPEDFARMNTHLWQVYQLARAKGAVYPLVRDQLTTLNDTLAGDTRGNSRPLLNAAADLFQLAGEVAFDANRHSDAAASYALAASVSRDAGAYDLWACALVRHAYVDMSERRYHQAAQILEAARNLSDRGDRTLSTRHWVASVQAEAYAGLGDLASCERAMDRAEHVTVLPVGSVNGGWLRFDGSRLAEERGARYVQLGRLDLAEEALKAALAEGALSSGQSFRRRAAVLADLAVIGAKRRDAEQVIEYGQEALRLARASSSGYVARRLQALCGEVGPLRRDKRVTDLGSQIAALSMS
jgi:transcriptional regulator with XRE-family HTH domain